MPYELTWESRTAMRCRFFGSVNLTELNRATNDFYNDYRSDHVTQALWDFSSMADFDVGKEGASEIACTDNAASGYMKPMKAAFISSDEAFLELIRHYIEEMDSLGSNWTNQAFSSLEDARAWISSGL